MGLFPALAEYEGRAMPRARAGFLPLWAVSKGAAPGRECNSPGSSGIDLVYEEVLRTPSASRC